MTEITVEFVKCWCCEYYCVCNDLTADIPENIAALCSLHNKVVSAHNEVCTDYLQNSGLHTEKVIPDYCKNYF